MKNYRTALGRNIDMAALAAKNERIRAVGNMSVNARGDTIDSTGKIIKPVTEKVNDSYSKTVGNKSANVIKKPVHRPLPKEKSTVKEELSSEELDLEASIEDDLEVEKIKAKESNKNGK